MTSNDLCEIKNIRGELLEEISKKLENDNLIEKTSSLFKILGDPTRIKIIIALKHHELCVCELSILLDMSQSSVSHQLRNLRQMNIVKFRKENKQIFYSLADDEKILNILKEGGEYGT